jgi:hypothetical protein
VSPLVTLSGLQRASICAASVVLPRFGHLNKAAALGNALHEMIERRIIGEEKAPELVANGWDLDGIERGRFFSLVRSFDPKIPTGTLAEVSIGLFDDGTVRPVQGGHGHYAHQPGMLIAGTIDAMWSGPVGLDGKSCPDGDTLWIVDWKTGDENNVPPPAKNWQLRAAAVLASKWTGAKRVVPAICFVEPGEGRWDIGAEIVADELEEIERIMVEMLRDIGDAAESHRQANGSVATVGPHCEHCPARPGCAAHVAEVKALVASDSGVDLTVPLTAEQASKIAGMIPSARKVLDLATKALRVYVAEHGPIPLADGKVYGPQHAKRDTYATRITYEALAREIGDVAADEAFGTSKTAMYEAIGAAHEAAGIKRKKGAAMAKVIGEIEANGGKTSKVIELWKPHYAGTAGTEES